MNYEQELYHYGVKGMKWGVRKKRAVVDGLVRRAVVGAGVPNSYGGGTKRQLSRAKKDLDILDNGGHLSIGITKKRQAAFDARDRAKLEKKISSLEAKEKTKAEKKAYNQSEEGKAARAEKLKKAAVAGAAVAGTALAVYGTYKVSKLMKEKAFDKAWGRADKATSDYLEKLNRKYVYPAMASGNKDSFGRALSISNKLSDKMSNDNISYAKRASSSTIAAVKELLNKNAEIPVGALLSSGIKVFGYENI